MSEARDDSVIVPNLADVLFGRGGQANGHTGNIYFRHIVRRNLLEYRRLSAHPPGTPGIKKKKTKLALAIVSAVQERGGRFLSQPDTNGRWVEVTEKESRKKASQALRDCPDNEEVDQFSSLPVPGSTIDHIPEFAPCKPSLVTSSGRDIGENSTRGQEQRRKQDQEAPSLHDQQKQQPQSQPQSQLQSQSQQQPQHFPKPQKQQQHQQRQQKTHQKRRRSSASEFLHNIFGGLSSSGVPTSFWLTPSVKEAIGDIEDVSSSGGSGGSGGSGSSGGRSGSDGVDAKVAQVSGISNSPPCGNPEMRNTFNSKTDEPEPKRQRYSRIVSHKTGNPVERNRQLRSPQKTLDTTLVTKRKNMPSRHLTWSNAAQSGNPSHSLQPLSHQPPIATESTSYFSQKILGSVNPNPYQVESDASIQPLVHPLERINRSFVPALQAYSRTARPQVHNYSPPSQRPAIKSSPEAINKSSLNLSSMFNLNLSFLFKSGSSVGYDGANERDKETVLSTAQSSESNKNGISVFGEGPRREEQHDKRKGKLKARAMSWRAMSWRDPARLKESQDDISPKAGNMTGPSLGQLQTSSPSNKGGDEREFTSEEVQETKQNISLGKQKKVMKRAMSWRDPTSFFIKGLEDASFDSDVGDSSSDHPKSPLSSPDILGPLKSMPSMTSNLGFTASLFNFLGSITDSYLQSRSGQAPPENAATTKVATEEEPTSNQDNFIDSGTNVTKNIIAPNNEALLQNSDADNMKGEHSKTTQDFHYDFRKSHVRHYRNSNCFHMYKIEEKIGTGNMGCVYKVTKKKQPSFELEKQIFALKLINLQTFTGEASSCDTILALRNEIDILKELDHPNIVRAKETHECEWERKPMLAVVMEFCPGGNLYTRPMYEEYVAKEILRQILSAVAYMHDKNVVHRDLKYENILFESMAWDAEVKIIDFGLSKKFQPGKVLKERAGTVQYMSPQVLHGEYTNMCDMWSIGVIAFMLLGGTKPFRIETRLVLDSLYLEKF